MPDAAEPERVDSEFWCEATPVCTRCLEPFDPLQHYCIKCGTAVGQLTPYIPFVNIPFNYSLYDRLWCRLFQPVWESGRRRIVYLLALIIFSVIADAGLILLVGTPAWYLRRRRPPGPLTAHPALGSA